LGEGGAPSTHNWGRKEKKKGHHCGSDEYGRRERRKGREKSIADKREGAGAGPVREP